jgi:hypothetical protein
MRPGSAVGAAPHYAGDRHDRHGLRHETLGNCHFREAIGERTDEESVLNGELGNRVLCQAAVTLLTNVYVTVRTHAPH